jgi:hypothetical protein
MEENGRGVEQRQWGSGAIPVINVLHRVADFENGSTGLMWSSFQIKFLMNHEMKMHVKSTTTFHEGVCPLPTHLM